jgi:hypothetical protein
MVRREGQAEPSKGRAHVGRAFGGEGIDRDNEGNDGRETRKAEPSTSAVLVGHGGFETNAADERKSPGGENLRRGAPKGPGRSEARLGGRGSYAGVG